MGSFAAGAGTKFLVTSTYSGPFAINAGTATTNTPALNVTQTWNNAAVTFTGWQFNVTDTASNAASLLMDLQVGGASRLYVDKTAKVWSNQPTVGNSSNFVAQQGASGNWLEGRWGASLVVGRFRVENGDPRFDLVLGGFIRWSDNATTLNTFDTGLRRTAAGVVSASDGSTGVGYLRTPATTVASLLSAATAGAGARAFVTDATVTTFASTVAGGGANAVPVVSNGTNWIIG